MAYRLISLSTCATSVNTHNGGDDAEAENKQNETFGLGTSKANFLLGSRSIWKEKESIRSGKEVKKT